MQSREGAFAPRACVRASRRVRMPTVQDFLREAAQAEGLSLRAYCKKYGILDDFRADPHEPSGQRGSEISLDGFGGEIGGGGDYDHCPACRRRRLALRDAEEYE